MFEEVRTSYSILRHKTFKNDFSGFIVECKKFKNVVIWKKGDVSLFNIQFLIHGSNMTKFVATVVLWKVISLFLEGHFGLGRRKKNNTIQFLFG